MLSMSSNSNLPELDMTCHLHSTSILWLMNQHRKENTKLCDVILQVHEKQYPAHRSVLAACSPYFLAMFNGEMKESSEKIVILKDVKDEIVQLLIDFVYTGHLSVNIENVESILEHATLLQISQVRRIACSFLEQQLDPVNCVGIRKFVSAHHCNQFSETVDNFIKTHFMEVISSEEFTSIPFNVLKDILSSEKLHVDCEEKVYSCVLKWIKHDPLERSKYLCELLTVTRLPLLQKRFIMSCVDKETLIKNDPTSRDLLDEAKNYYLQPENHANLRSPRTIPRHSAAGCMYVVGGKEAGEAIINKAERFSLFHNEWTEIAPLKRRRQQHGVCGVGNKLYAIGGSDGGTRLSSVEVYCPVKNKWFDTTPLQTCRSGAGTGVLANTIYAFGGYDGRFCLGTVERFDPASERWEYVAPINVTRSFPGVAAVDSRLFAIGGNDGLAFLDSCEYFDPLTNKWNFITPMPSPRAGVGCAVLDGILYVAGGFDGTKRLDAVDTYDPRMNEWRPVSPMNTCRDGLRMVTYAGYVYAIGGIDGPSYLNTVEYYDPTTDKWTESIPMGSARAAAGVAVLMNDSL